MENFPYKKNWGGKITNWRKPFQPNSSKYHLQDRYILFLYLLFLRERKNLHLIQQKFKKRRNKSKED